MKFLRYRDLKAMGVVNSRMTARRLMDAQGFPTGKLITPDARAWTEDEIDAWTANRSTARKPAGRQCGATSTEAETDFLMKGQRRTERDD